MPRDTTLQMPNQMDTTISNADRDDLDTEKIEETEEREEEEVEFEDEPDDEPVDEPEPGQEPEKDDAEARKARRQSQIDRLKKERDEWKAKAEANKSKQPTDADDAVIARLEIRGVTDPEDQAEVIRFAKAEGKSPVEVLNDDFMKSRLEHLKAKREQRQAAQRPGNRTGVPQKDVEHYIRTGKMPTDRAMFEKVSAELARRARENA